MDFNVNYNTMSYEIIQDCNYIPIMSEKKLLFSISK